MPGKVDIDVGYIAELARIELEDGDRKGLQKDMESILGYIEQLSELDVSGIEPTAHAAPLFNVWREDKAGTPFSRDTMLENAPASVDGELVKVPKVLPGEEMS